MTFKLKPEIIDEIKYLTNNCYNRYKLLLDYICKKLDIKCFDSDFDDSRISGMLIRNKETNKFEIYVNRKHSDTRQRFTVAHEIGHYLSWKHQSYSYEQLNKENEIEDYAISFRHESIQSDAETEANEIAATILMPEDKVRDLAKENLTIEEMAEKFFVSESAMTIRLQALYKGVQFV
jgi:Zn-dependent peptidase ImmA (M78 family)